VIKTSLEAVQRIIGRAVTDSTFRNLLQTNPDEVFAGRDVTAEETQALRGMNWDAPSSTTETNRFVRLAGRRKLPGRESEASPGASRTACTDRRQADAGVPGDGGVLSKVNRS